jgi:aspartyl aminopeptidase
MTKSFLISADMAHALHPNYPEKYEDQHRPMMNKGVVIKHNANQRYATTSLSAVLLRQIAEEASIPLQAFVVRNDSPCGSTIGPMLSAKLGIRTIDVGNPQWSMHSIRETCGTTDLDSAVKLFKAYFDRFAYFDERIQSH